MARERSRLPSRPCRGCGFAPWPIRWRGGAPRGRWRHHRLVPGRGGVWSRALGHRSIIGDPRTLETKRRLDRDIKRRAAFRPYAPALLRSEAAAWIDLSPDQKRVGEAPLRLMLLAPAIRPDLRARVPAVVHLDGSARCQIVEDGAGEGLAPLVAAFHRRTGIPLVLNTSFNGPGEPIVETPADAVRALFDLNLDALFIGHLEVCGRRKALPAAGARHPADFLSS